MCRHSHFQTGRLADALGVSHRRREEAGRRHDERKSYIFDLDVRESAEDEDEDETEKFSVDGHAYGMPSCLGSPAQKKGANVSVDDRELDAIRQVRHHYLWHLMRS